MQNPATKTADRRSSGWVCLITSLLAGCLYLFAVYHSYWGLMVLMAAIFTATLSSFVARLINKLRAYRLALLASLALSAGGWGLGQSIASQSVGFWLPLLSLAASLLGAMVSSWAAHGFVEDTFIPSDEVNSRIEQLYQANNDQQPRKMVGKRIFDFSLAFLGIIFSLPLWLLITVLVWLQDPGPIFFVKHCTGCRGKPFRLYKFRTMPVNAEEDTGPVVSSTGDQRVSGVCRLLRRTALDELPQLGSILMGDMSFVGPRPLRSVVEIENIQQIPGYARRYNTPPGLAGLAQICGSNLTPPRNKLRYETIYARHASVLFDIKLIAIACLLVFYLRWTKDWNGRVPRAWIRFGSRNAAG